MNIRACLPGSVGKRNRVHAWDLGFGRRVVPVTIHGEFVPIRQAGARWPEPPAPLRPLKAFPSNRS